MTRVETFELQLSRFICAPREKVFDAFVTREALTAWMCPRGMSIPEATVDARVGGRYRVVMRARDGSTFIVGGAYREIERPRRLVYTWQWEGETMPNVETVITLTFTERDGGAQLDMHHTGFPDAGMRDSHSAGWSSTFNRLIDLLDERGSAATVTLLGDPRSSYTRSARMGLAEKGVKYTLAQTAPPTPEILAVFEEAYGGRDYLVGNAMCMADLFLAPILAYVEVMPEGTELLAAVPNVRRAQAAIRERPSFKDTEPPRG